MDGNSRADVECFLLTDGTIMLQLKIRKGDDELFAHNLGLTISSAKNMVNLLNAAIKAARGVA